MPEREIDLLDLLMKELRKWKVFLVAALIGGALVMLGGYIKSVRSYQAQIKAADYQKVKVKKEIKKLTKKMPRKSIDTALRYYEETINLYSQDEYLENSLFMKLDGNNVHRLSYTLTLTGIPKDADENEVVNRTEKVVSILYSDDFIDLLCEKVYDGGKEQYVRELVGVGKSYITTMTDVIMPEISLSFTLFKDADSKTCVSVVENYFTSLNKRLQDCAVKVIAKNESYTVDRDLASRQLSMPSAIKDLRAKLDSEKEQMTDDENKLAELYILRDTGMTREKYEKATQEELKKLEKPKVSFKFLLIGLFLGVCCVLGIDFVKVMLRDKVNALGEAGDALNVRPLLACYEQEGQSTFSDSRYWYQKQHHKYEDTESQFQNLSRQLAMVLEGREDRTIELLYAEAPDEKDREFVNRIRERVKEAGITLSERETQFIGDIDMGSQLNGDAPVIFYVRQERTSFSGLYKLGRMAEENNREAAGFIYVDC